MTVLTLVFLISLMDLVQAASPSKIMRTQMDVDYTGRVRQAPGANAIHVGREKHEVRDEEEDEPIEANEDEDEAGSDWQARKVPNLPKPVLTAMNQVNQAIKQTETMQSKIGDEVIRQAAKIPWGHLDDDDSLFHQAEDKIENSLGSGLTALTGEDGALANLVDAVDEAVSQDLKSKGEDSLVDKIKNVMPISSSVAQTAGNIAGQHFPKLIKDVQQDIKAGDAGKVLADVQGHLKAAPMDAVNEIVKDQMKNVASDPLRAIKIAGDAAKLAEDVKNLQNIVKK